MSSKTKKALAKAEGWLKSTPPRSLEMLADRMLVRALASGGPTPELKTLIAKLPPHLSKLDTKKKPASDSAPTPGPDGAKPAPKKRDWPRLVQISWVLGVVRDPAAGALNRRIQAELGAFLETAQEPERSLAFYWAHRAGFVPERPSWGPVPTSVTPRLRMDIDQMLFATDYGTREVPLFSLDQTLDPELRRLRVRHKYQARLRETSPALTASGLVAKALVAELSLTPRREAWVDDLTAGLLAAQTPKGNFRLGRKAASLTDSHEACCWASLALAKLG